MRYILLVAVLTFFSCGKDRVVLLPEINQSEITEINDVSAAYLFYDETQKDSLELNRKNLISTTNWLVNVDKRLTLKQAIPYIKFLQEKKSNSSHKNEKAKNYFSCNDISLKNLGFIDFTDLIYHEESSENYLSKVSNLEYTEKTKVISFNLDNDISLIDLNSKSFISQSSKENLLNNLKELDSIETNIYLNFQEDLSFQDYITYKSLLLNADLEFAKISNKEFLHN